MILDRFRKSPKKIAMGEISYAQCGEDIIVNYIFKNILKYQPAGILDIGAHHPIIFNNTYYFYKFKGKIVSIDANPEVVALLKKFRPNDINLNCAVSDTIGHLTYYKMKYDTLNTISADRAKQFEKDIESKITIDTVTLVDVVEKYFNGVFPDYFSLDVEGLEEKIISQMFGCASLPKVICLETALYNGEGDIGIKNTDLQKYLIDRGYLLYADTFVNSIFIDKKILTRV